MDVFGSPFLLLFSPPSFATLTFRTLVGSGDVPLPFGDVADDSEVVVIDASSILEYRHPHLSLPWP